MKKILFLLTTFLMVFLISCGTEETKKEIKFDKTNIDLVVDETFIINVSDVSFNIAENDIIEFSQDTLQIKALKAGTVKIVLKLISDESVTKEITVTVKEKEVKEYTITYDLDGGNCDELTTKFTDGSKVELPTPTKDNMRFDGWYDGENKIESLENKDYTLKAKWVNLTPEEIEIEVIKNDEIVFLDSEISLKATVKPTGVEQKVTWKSLNKVVATIDENGVITILEGGQAEFQATSTVDTKLKVKMNIDICNYRNPMNLIKLLEVEEVAAKKCQSFMKETNNTYVLGGVCNYLFENIKVIENFCAVGAANRPGTTCNGNAFKLRYVTVHDVGWTGSAEVTSRNCVNSTDTSWHYSTGNDGIYQQLPLNEVGWHAGDGTGTALTFTDTLIKAPDGDDTPAKVTINQVTGCFEMNGVATTIKAPLSEWGTIVKDSQLPYTGINNYVDSETGTYMLGATYWNTTYDTLSNRGGNLNSIGIETSVLFGSNLYYTWELTAKLIAQKILKPCNLLPRDVKQHNTFSGKDCPMTMRHAGMWENFMALVEAEYYKTKYFSDWDLTFTTDSAYLNQNGMIKELPDVETEVSFSIRLSNGTNYDKTFDYKIKLPAKSVITY